MTSPPLRSLRTWPRRAFHLVRFGSRFVRALLVSNLQMARVVLFRPVRDLAPDFIAYPISGLTPLEIVVLSHCITLTPGTTSVEISADRTTLLVHALEADDPAGVCAAIKRDLEAPLLAWTR
jgi:multisubunit Na+/H+ antiporter MnhE subunit